MESGVSQECKSLPENQDVTTQRANFQKFIYELFEKNGILNDLRAYLREHIVNVLQTAKTGDTPLCQKRFTQRLQLTFQALNILIAEYLFRLDFNYSLSVFVSEIPLANMVFDFAKTLMKKSEVDESEIRFTDKDVWSILNYLGVQCDSDHASYIIEMYRTDRQISLLLCILKCLPMYQKETLRVEHAISSEDSLSSVKSFDGLVSKDCKNTHKDQSMTEKCDHITHCISCQNRIIKIKNRVKKKSKYFSKNVNSSVKPLKDEKLMKNINILERALIDEMFQQLQSVYEAEVKLIKEEEEKKVKRSIASHALQLQNHRDELEEAFKAREAQLEQSVIQKKKFLWGLARALRDQHRHLTQAMRDVRLETQRLATKEESLKTQLAEAELILKKRSEEMRVQISDELTILEGHLNSMKTERELINRERSELENIKAIESSNSKMIKVHNLDSEELRSHYDLLKNELVILKKYLESSKFTPKCVIERGTITDPCDEGLSKVKIGLNNSQIADRSKNEDVDDRLKNQVVNNFKKKNVNFGPSKLDEIYRERSHSLSSASSEAGDTAHPSDVCDRDTLHRLRQENYRLKACARQQQCHIDVLARACAGAAPQAAADLASAPGPAPHTVPLPTPTAAPAQQYFLHSANTSASANTISVGWRKGAGEELSMFTDAQPRILVPGDSIPFVGVLSDRDRHGTSRKQLMSQWRGLKSRTFPLSGVSKRSSSPIKERPGSNGNTVILSSQQDDTDQPTHSMGEKTKHHPKSATTAVSRNREKSPKSVLREAKEKLRNIKEAGSAARPASPNAVLREAKLRLRKLEIEAEAVEQSYIDFRRKQSSLRLAHAAHAALAAPPSRDLRLPNLAKSLDLKQSRSLLKLDDTNRNAIDIPLTEYQKSIRNDFDKYFREYKTKLDLGEARFRSQTITNSTKPTPKAYPKMNEDNIDVHDDFLETSLIEFRKLYQPGIEVAQGDSPKSFVKQEAYNSELSDQGSLECDDSAPASKQSSRRGILMPEIKCNKTNELEILNNMNKMYNISKASELVEQSTIVIKEVSNTDNQNLLRVEVESASDMKTEAQDMLLVVQNIIDIREVSKSQCSRSEKNISGQITIIMSPRGCNPENGEGIGFDMEVQSPERGKRSSSPEQEAHLTRNDVLDAIFYTDTNIQKSSTVIHSEPSKDNLESLGSPYEKRDDYADDFSADVDNTHNESNSPISLVKTSEDENYWDM